MVAAEFLWIPVSLAMPREEELLPLVSLKRGVRSPGPISVPEKWLPGAVSSGLKIDLSPGVRWPWRLLTQERFNSVYASLDVFNCLMLPNSHYAPAGTPKPLKVFAVPLPILGNFFPPIRREASAPR